MLFRSTYVPGVRKPKNPIYEVYIQAEDDMGLYYKHLAEGGRVHEMSKFAQMVLYRNVNLYFKEYVRRTSVPVKKFLPTAQVLPATHSSISQRVGRRIEFYIDKPQPADFGC